LPEPESSVGGVTGVLIQVPEPTRVAPETGAATTRIAAANVDKGNP